MGAWLAPNANGNMCAGCLGADTRLKDASSSLASAALAALTSPTCPVASTVLPQMLHTVVSWTDSSDSPSIALTLVAMGWMKRMLKAMPRSDEASAAARHAIVMPLRLATADNAAVAPRLRTAAVAVVGAAMPHVAPHMLGDAELATAVLEAALCNMHHPSTIVSGFGQRLVLSAALPLALAHLRLGDGLPAAGGASGHATGLAGASALHAQGTSFPAAQLAELLDFLAGTPSAGVLVGGSGERKAAAHRDASWVTALLQQLEQSPLLDAAGAAPQPGPTIDVK